MISALSAIVGWQWTPFTLPIAIAAFLIFLNLLYLIHRKRTDESIPGITLASGFLACIVVVMTFYALELSATDSSALLLFKQLQYVGAVNIMAFLVGYLLVYTGRESLLSPRTYALLFLPGAVTTLVVITNDAHWLFWTELRTTTEGSYVFAASTRGPAYFAYIAYSYTFIFACVTLLVESLVRTHGKHQWQTLGLLIGISIPATGRLLDLFGTVPAHWPRAVHVGLVITAVAITWPVLRHDLFTIIPVARRTIVDQMDEGVLVCDEDDIVVDVNPAASDLLGREESEAVGAAAVDLLAPLTDTEEVCLGDLDDLDAVRMGNRTVDLSVSPLSQAGQPVGSLVLLRDVTDLVEYRFEVERQNEQLEQFASVVSHDLRNPISIVRGWVDIAEEQHDDLRVGPIHRSLDRMDTLIDELLSLARAGETVSETQPIELADVATRAWKTVDTAEATLTVDTRRTIYADSVRLQQALENLFRNAVEHAGTDATVRLLDVPTGFAIEDDGPGIPPEERADVFEWGVTSAVDGTGFGLSIVEQIVEAHGWRIRATEGTRGGARFEITGVNISARSDDLPADGQKP